MIQLCECCKIKKVSILQAITNSCKCDYKYLCTMCKYPDKHKCTFDYKNKFQKIIEKNNIKIEADKFTKM